MWLFYVALFILVFVLVNRFYKPKYLKELQEEEFRNGYRKAQLIDVREQGEYEAGHILGARNIPLSQLKQRQGEIRADKPVYLYCQSGTRSSRAAQFLKKKRQCEDISHLKGGFRKWNGKIKK
ncbi:MAG: rhodanese-like domain-containing protein [Bacillaceae bacterium]|nr:rhodanese-like domain-containing protein [Bacillaceae bacterium]